MIVVEGDPKVSFLIATKPVLGKALFYSLDCSTLYIYICVCVCVCVCIYIYRERERDTHTHTQMYPNIFLQILLSRHLVGQNVGMSTYEEGINKVIFCQTDITSFLTNKTEVNMNLMTFIYIFALLTVSSDGQNSRQKRKEWGKVCFLYFCKLSLFDFVIYRV